MGTITIQELRLLGYTGNDASLEESLLNYGLVWVNARNQDPTMINIIYGVTLDPETDEYDNFCNASMNLYEFQEFFHTDKLRDGIEKFTGIRIGAFVEQFPYSLLALIQYYGNLNVFGDPGKTFKVVK